MKKLIILSAIALSGITFNTADAQIRLHLGLRFGPRIGVYAAAPVVVEQAPVYEQAVPAYNDAAQVDNNNDDYYYLPDVDAYYDVNAQCYYYNDGNNWISAAYLPGQYRNYDWRNAPRFEVRAARPYLHDDFYRSKFNGRQAGGWVHNNYDNHFNGGFANRTNNRDDHFENRQQNGYNNRPAQPNREQGGFNNHFDNRGEQGGNNRPQPSNQNNNRGRDTRGGSEHFSQNNTQGGSFNHRMSKF